jgi:hypothetical protein
VVKDFYGFQSGFSVMNVGTAATTITATYNFGGTSYTQTSPSLGPNQSWAVYMNPGPTELAGVSGLAGSVTFTADQPIVAIINEDNRTSGWGATYNGVPSSGAMTTAVAPQVLSMYYGYSGGVQVMNAGTASATMTATYSGGPSDVTIQKTVAAGDVWQMFAPDELAAAGASAQDFNGSVVVTSDQPIVGIYNLAYMSPGVDSRWPANYGDSMSTNNTIAR